MIVTDREARSADVEIAHYRLLFLTIRRAGWIGAVCAAHIWSAADCVATLSGANLQGANLRGADLRDVTLYGADLCGARMDDARVSMAQLWQSCGDERTRLPGSIYRF